MDKSNADDEIEVCQNVEPHEADNSVKSKAVVKYSAVQVPAKFARLQCNTDLNLPPSNWLSSSANTYGLQQALYNSTGFASFQLAHMFPDCLGEVDVVSDAENIKKLLKLPYAPKSVFSMVVHKIGNTLLIDEFDIQKYLLRKADDDWKWLRTFILENILSSLSEKDRNFCLKDKSRVALQRKNLLSKFLYHSLQQADIDADSPTNSNTNESTSGNDDNPINFNNGKPLPLTGPVLPEPNVEENVPDPKSNHVFNRNVVWTFEDIRMLIGTDMPIFGGGKRPCISLRLRDMTKPINVLTGIDYWLDNLMCNVPDVVMCYHLDGIVQKYELIKTEDLPYLENSQFSPQVIRNVAQNILAFLKANATKAGHTYWLFKGKNDDVVKLYDLTTLCKNENCDPKYENPFTVPVAMLLYKVARNLKNSNEKISARKAGSIKALLDNCIKLLPKEKYPQIVTSSHYILSDLHVPAGTDPKFPNFENSDGDSDSSYEDDFITDCDSVDEEGDGKEPNVNGNNSSSSSSSIFSDMLSNNVATKSICDTLKEFSSEENSVKYRPPSPLISSVEERCKISLKHICDGLDCLKYFESNEEKISEEENKMKKNAERERIIHEEQHPNMAKPFQPIPLPYQSLKSEPKMTNPDIAIPMRWDEKNTKPPGGGKKSLAKSKSSKKQKSGDTDDSRDGNKDGHDFTTDKSNGEEEKLMIQEKTKFHGSWNVHLKLLLLEKACLTYATLAEQNYAMENYGTCLKYIYMSLRSLRFTLRYLGLMPSRKICLFGRAGDCFFQFAKNWDNIDEYLQQFNDVSDTDKIILNQIEKDSEAADSDYDLIEPMKNVEQLMLLSCKCYEIAIASSPSKQSPNELIRRLGSVRNELALKYMYWAQEEYAKFMKETDDEEQTTNDDKTKRNEKKKNKYYKKENEPLYQILARNSYENLKRGIMAFEEVEDNVNLSFLYCNMGRFMRFRAFIQFQGECTKDLRTQKRFYNHAFYYYERALGILENRKRNPDLWDLVNWELSTATFTLAKHVQDWSSCELSTEEVEKEIVELLQKSLKLCNVEHPGSRQVLYTYRSGLIHFRLASFYHKRLLKMNDNSGKKTDLQLSRLHYQKASKILENLNEVKDFLTVQLERAALQDFLAESANFNQKIKLLQGNLEIFLQSKLVFDHILVENNTENFSSEDMLKLFKLFESRLQLTLKKLVKLCLSKTEGAGGVVGGARGSGNPRKDTTNHADMYKQMYSKTLNVLEITNEQKYAEHLRDVLEKIIEIKRQ